MILPNPMESPEETLKDATSVFERLKELNAELLKEEDMKRVLKRLMDSAVELSRAENGFLLVRSEALGVSETVHPSLPGFVVAAAKNVRKQEIGRENSMSLTAVRQAIETGRLILTSNAQQDERFRDANSVLLGGLRSILALPLKGPAGILGVFYLDHRMEVGVFEEEILPALETFAGIAALALQKGRMIEDLRNSNSDLSHQVEIRSSQVALMERELRESRRKLKNEYREIIGRSPQMMEVLSLVDRVTESKIPVWIYGESGTGKEAIARALHFNSSRAKFPFVSENCSALPEGLLESELFGHKKGAFTQATQDKKGLLEYAHQGTVFLDEIADMSLNLQAKLLRFLQEGEIRPVGSHHVVTVDVRVVSASNRNLPQLAKTGAFREDLFYRLNGVTVTLPPLRDRLEDLPLLAEHFLKKIAEREKRPPVRLKDETLRILLNYPWPGNVRELQHTLETAVLYATPKGEIIPESLRFKPSLLEEKGPVAAPAVKGVKESEPSEEIQRILSVLRDHRFHRGRAAEALGISRRHLYRKLKEYGVP